MLVEKVSLCDLWPRSREKALNSSAEERLRFAETFKTEQFHIAAGTTFMQQGMPGEHLYTVLKGWAFRYKSLDDGRRQILGYALPSDMLGLQGCLMQELHHSVEALTDLTLCGLSRHRLWELYSGFPSLAFDLTWLAARELKTLDDQLLSVGQRSALERTACLLLHLFARAEEEDLIEQGKLQLPLTQQHLADTLGMSLVHTNKTLKRIYEAKAVRWRGRSFELLDRDALRRLAADG
ncbi:MAG TPA: Crp/Fnr family transcriptional regulator [Pseudolabrys sp.]|nr:Crp/Fnr family transcriptional regulator [Pseudolabrys sp.]